APLRALTAEIYRLSSASNEVIALSSPVDALRQFLLTGGLHSNYLTSTTLGVADLAQAHQAANQIMAEMHSRPTTNLTLFVRADTFSAECVLLDAPNAG